jgi:hypothetical protein
MTREEACRVCIILMNDDMENGRVFDTPADAWARQHGLVLSDIEPHMSDAFRARWDAYIDANTYRIASAAGYGMAAGDVGAYVGTVALAAIGTVAAPVVRVAAVATYWTLIGVMWVLGFIVAAVLIAAAMA